MDKSAGEGNLGNAHGSIFQQMAACLQPVVIQKVNGRLLQVLTEYRAAFTSSYISGSGNVFQGKFFSVMLAYVGDHGSLDGQIRDRLFFLPLSFLDRKDAFFFQNMAPHLT